MKEQQELENIIKHGTIKDIRVFSCNNFHKIKHTLSFQLLTDRLEMCEIENKKLKNEIAALADSMEMQLSVLHREKDKVYIEHLRKLSNKYTEYGVNLQHIEEKALCMSANQSCPHYASIGKCNLPSTSKCHNKRVTE